MQSFVHMVQKVVKLEKKTKLKRLQGESIEVDPIP